MLVGSKQTFYICKATYMFKKASQHFSFFLFLATYNKEEMMAYAFFLTKQNRNIHVSIFCFSSLQKKGEIQVSIFRFLLQLQQDACRCCKVLASQ